MENPKIQSIDELLAAFFKTAVMKISEFTIKPLTVAGENYGSQMLSVKIRFQNETVLNVVAKMCPPNEWLKEMFHTAISFKKEIAMYRTIFPALKAFQTEQGMSDTIAFLPECYGARISLNPCSETVDDDAVLLLENLKLGDYKVVDRMKGFNLKETELIIKDLAIFHAVPLGMKLLKPKMFQETILPHLGELQAFDKLSESSWKSIIDVMIKTTELSEECAPLIAKVSEALNECLNNLKNRKPPREPFATINHNDYWVNNTMIKYDLNNEPVKNKIVDFQLIEYGSPGNDIVFFLFSSVQKPVLENCYDSLLRLYHETFIDTLKNLKCDTEAFSYEALLDEIEISAKETQFFHVMDMLLPICALRDKVKELSEMTEEDLIMEGQLSDLYKRRVPETVLEFSKRNWI